MSPVQVSGTRDDNLEVLWRLIEFSHIREEMVGTAVEGVGQGSGMSRSGLNQNTKSRDMTDWVSTDVPCAME